MKVNTSEFKISFNSQIKRFPVPQSFSDFKTLIAKSFELNENQFLNKYDVSYSDSDDDLIAISSNFDLEQAKNYMKVNSLKLLKLTLTEKRKSSICDFELVSKEEIQNDENIESNYVKIEKATPSNIDINIEPKVYDLLLKDLKANFDLRRFNNQQILDALKFAKGDTDLALQALFK